MSKLLLATTMAQAVAMGNPIRARTRDQMMTFDQRTVDSSGAFLVGELERLDQTMHEPLASVTWSRDIDLRSDVSIADETSSFTNSTLRPLVAHRAMVNLGSVRTLMPSRYCVRYW